MFQVPLRSEAPARLGLLARCVGLLAFLGLAHVLPAQTAAKLYSVDRASPRLREINPQTGQTLGSVTITLPGRTISGATGLAADPVTGKLFALLRLSAFSQGTPSVRFLATIDPASGVATLLGVADNGTGLAMSDLAASPDGRLFATAGDADPIFQAALYVLSKTTGAPTLFRRLGNGDDGEAIGYNPNDGMLYHASGQNGTQVAPAPPNLVFERVDINDLARSPERVQLSGPAIDEATALVHVPGTQNFLWPDLNFNGHSTTGSRLMRVTQTGQITQIGIMDHVAMGLAFFPPASGCTYSLTPSSATVGSPGGTGTISVAAPNGCAWTARSNASYVSITSGASGNGNGTVNFTVAANTGNSERRAAISVADVSFFITQRVPPGRLSVSPPRLEFTGTAGGTLAAQTLLISSSGGPIAWSASAASSAPNLLTVTPGSGTVDTTASSRAVVAVNTLGLAAGVHQGTITVRSASGDSALAVPVQITMLPAGPRLQLSQSTVVFFGASGGANPAAQTVRVANTGESALNWSIANASVPSWLTLSGTAGSVAPLGGGSPLTLTPRLTGLAAGIYQAVVPVVAAGAANSPQNLVVTLRVATADVSAMGEASPAGMLFVAQQGGAAPAAQSLSIGNIGAGTVNYSLAASTTSGGSWLNVSQTSGNTASGPGAATVSVNPAGLAPGAYSGKITATYTPASRGPQEVAVVFVVSADPVVPAGDIPAQRAVPVQALCAPEPLQLAATTVGNGLTLPVSYPRTLLVQLVDSCGNNVNGASVVATVQGFSIVLSGSGGGVYSGTWTPDAAGTAVDIAIVAHHPNYASVSRSFSVDTFNTTPLLPAVSPNGVVEGAGFSSLRPLAPGGIVSIFGSRLATAEQSASVLPLPTTLGGTSVTMFGQPAPLFFAGPTQINAQVPFEARAGEQMNIVVSSGGLLAAPQNYLIAPNQPGVFQSAGIAAVLDAQFRNITAANPARVGEVIQIFATGLGAVEQEVGSGSPAPPFSTVRIPVSVQLGNVTLPVLYQGLAPGFVGLYQVNVQLTATVPTGEAVPLVITQGGVASNPNLPVAIPVR